MSSTEHTDHKTGTAWLNELGVLSALSRTKNEPLYVAEIARQGPPVRRLSNWELKHFNKPGIKAACVRLKKLGIVDSKPSVTPKKKGDTEHYFIRPSLKALSDIYLNYGSGILGVVREAEFGQAIIASDMANFLGSRLHASRGLDGIVDPSDLREIESMARDSTKALGMLLGNEIPFDLPVKNEESRQLPLTSTEDQGGHEPGLRPRPDDQACGTDRRRRLEGGGEPEHIIHPRGDEPGREDELRFGPAHREARRKLGGVK